jgi:hypothetical protein
MAFKSKHFERSGEGLEGEVQSNDVRSEHRMANNEGWWRNVPQKLGQQQQGQA